MISKSRGEKRNYFEFGKYGHFRRDCSRLKRGKKQKGSTNIVDIGNSDDSDNNIEVVLFMNSDHKKKF